MNGCSTVQEVKECKDKGNDDEQEMGIEVRWKGIKNTKEI
jgi:hypothetical protein